MKHFSLSSLQPPRGKCNWCEWFHCLWWHPPSPTPTTTTKKQQSQCATLWVQWFSTFSTVAKWFFFFHTDCYRRKAPFRARILSRFFGVGTTRISISRVLSVGWNCSQFLGKLISEHHTESSQFSSDAMRWVGMEWERMEKQSENRRIRVCASLGVHICVEKGEEWLSQWRQQQPFWSLPQIQFNSGRRFNTLCPGGWFVRLVSLWLYLATDRMEELGHKWIDVIRCYCILYWRIWSER